MSTTSSLNISIFKNEGNSNAMTFGSGGSITFNGSFGPNAYAFNCWEDAKARWEIHKKEFNELIEDIKKLINFLKPLIVDAFNKVKERIMSFIKRK